MEIINLIEIFIGWDFVSYPSFFAKKKNANPCSIGVLCGTPERDRTATTASGGPGTIHYATGAYVRYARCVTYF